MKAAQKHEFFSRLQAAIPHPKTELQYQTPFELLIAVMLSAQSTDKAVNLATAKLFPLANTPQQLLLMGLDGLERYIRTIGLYHSKARHILATCEILLKEYQGQVPDSREALESLPGVGRKTANVMLNTAFGHPTIAVDTHVFRVANRTGLAVGKTPLAVELKLLKAVPEAFKMDAHHLLILHGRYTCMARQPRCDHCVVRAMCGFARGHNLKPSKSSSLP